MKDRKRFDEIAQRQGGLKKQLTAGQMSMLAIGGAIGTGLFLGSAYAIQMAGPSVLQSNNKGAEIARQQIGIVELPDRRRHCAAADGLPGGDDFRASDPRLIR